MRIGPQRPGWKCAALALLVAAAPVAGTEAPGGWRWTLDARLRYEQVDDDAFARDASALTLRTRLGVVTPAWQGFSATLEAEDVRALDEDYNSTANGRTQYPVVADPEGSEWNQAFVAWQGTRNRVAAGRQRVILDNQRFFGNVGFRQNEQTFDAVAADLALGPATLRYRWLDEVHKINGNENPNPTLRQQDLDAHLVNLAWPTDLGTLTGYGYFVDNNDLPLTSARTLGLRFAGQRACGNEAKLGYALEYADQADYADGAATIDAEYWLAEGTWSRGRHAVRAGYELLGGNGAYAFQTPFATLHAFNGWADKFLVTPAGGLGDAYAEYAIKLGAAQSVQAIVAYHDFRADAGDADYGTEWDALLRWTARPWLELELKAADYAADDFARDTTKVWLAATVRH